MPFILTYLFKLSLSLAVVFLFYRLVLRRLTFYNWNRWYLVGYSLLCFFIPFINISPVLQKNEWAGHTIGSWVPVLTEYAVADADGLQAEGFLNRWNIISLVIITGMFIMFLRLFLQLVSFRRMMKKAEAIPAENINLFQVDERIIPFSFGNSIFINRHLHSPDEFEEIVRHEFVHVKQKHSVDIIWGELLCLFNWFNPFAWMLKRSIRQNLEFIADNKVLENGIDRKQYQYLLLKVIGNNQFSIAPKFNFSSLKTRIAMMNKLKTAKLHLLRFLFILPLLAVVLLAFRQQQRDQHDSISNNVNSPSFRDTIPGLNEKGYIVDVTGSKNNAMVTVKDKNGKLIERISYNKWKGNEKYYTDKYGEFAAPPTPPLPPTPPAPPQPMELPENVTKFDVNDKTATVLLKNGTEEKYDLGKPEEKAKFEKKYGGILPTPPVPPVPPARRPDPALTRFLERNPGVENIGWVYNNVRENEVVMAVILKKDGTKEEYDLRNYEQRTKVEREYGELPLPPSTSPVPSSNSQELTAAQEVNRATISDNFEITDKKATIHLKDGTVEEYDLARADDRKKFDEKYGGIVTADAKIEGMAAPVKVIGTIDGRAVIAPMSIPGEVGVAWLNEDGALIVGEEEILATITKKTTQQELEALVKQMKGKGVELKITNSEYHDGKLVSISGTVVSISGTSVLKGATGSFSGSDFNKLILSVIKDEEHVYFRVRTTENKTVI